MFYFQLQTVPIETTEEIDYTKLSISEIMSLNSYARKTTNRKKKKIIVS